MIAKITPDCLILIGCWKVSLNLIGCLKKLSRRTKWSTPLDWGGSGLYAGAYKKFVPFFRTHFISWQSVCCGQYENPLWLDELKQVYRQGRVCENCFIIILCCIICRKQLPPCSHFGFALLSPRRCSHKFSEEALKYQDLPTATHLMVASFCTKTDIFTLRK